MYKGDKEFKYESFWRDKYNDSNKDSKGHIFPWPQEGKIWSDQDQFVNRLETVEKYLRFRNKYIPYDNKDAKSCILCGQKNISKGMFKLTNVYWEDGLKHYIKKHNIKPSSDFIELIYKFQPLKSKNKIKIARIKGVSYKISDVQYIKLDRNQIMIMDALMKHGGYTKKYIDRKNKNIYRFSEHAGLLDFNNSGLERIIISGNTNRVDRGDDEIFLPKNIKDAVDYEYIFHTHPPTPKPGGRVKLGILYEFPSPSDIFHFLDHFNDGVTQGSLVVTPEGMYNIRKLKFDRVKIKIDEDMMYDEIRDIFREVQDEAIKKYGMKFNTYQFYSKIAPNRTYIEKVNTVLNKYEMHIDYFPRIKDTTGKWIIDTIHLPIYVIE